MKFIDYSMNGRKAPLQLLRGELRTLKRHAPLIGVRPLDDAFGAAFNSFWHSQHIRNLGQKAPPPSKLSRSLWKVLLVDMTYTYVACSMINKRLRKINLIYIHFTLFYIVLHCILMLLRSGIHRETRRRRVVLWPWRCSSP